MIALYIICLGFLIMATDDLYTAKPEHDVQYRDNDGILRTITLPAIEGGLSATDIGFLIMIIGTMLVFCTVVDHHLTELEMVIKK